MEYIRDPTQDRAALMGVNAAHHLHAFERIMLVGDKTVKRATADQIQSLTGSATQVSVDDSAPPADEPKPATKLGAAIRVTAALHHDPDKAVRQLESSGAPADAPSVPPPNFPACHICLIPG